MSEQGTERQVKPVGETEYDTTTQIKAADKGFDGIVRQLV